MLFIAADEFNEFNLAQHFDVEKEPDVRLRMHGLYERTKETVQESASSLWKSRYLSDFLNPRMPQLISDSEKKKTWPEALVLAKMRTEKGRKQDEC